MKITLEHLTSGVARKVEYWYGEYDPAEIEDGVLDVTYGTMEVTFMSGRSYEYAEVTVGTFAELIKAVSFGKFLNQEIKPYHEVRETTPADLLAEIQAKQAEAKALKASLA